MSDPEAVGWGMYWSGKEKDKQISELIAIIQQLDRDSPELGEWRAKVIQRAQDKEDRKIKRELKRLKIL